MLALAVLPVLALGIVLLGVGMHAFSKSMENHVQKEMTEETKLILKILDQNYPGEFSLNKDEKGNYHIYKGGKDITKDTEFKKQHGWLRLERGRKIMQITDVRVRKVEKEGKMKAVVSITIDEEFVVHDIKVIEGEKGLFIAMPSRKAADGEYRDIAHPINSDTRSRIQQIILDKYEAEIAAEEAAE